MTKPNLRSDNFDEFCEAWKLADQAERAAYAQILAETPADELTDIERLKLDTMQMMAGVGEWANTDNDDQPDAAPPPPTARPFPIGALPHWARPFVEELAHGHQAPIDLPALVAIGALSAVATRGRSTLRILGAWIESPNLYLAISLPPGAGKSPIMNALLGPVEEVQRLTQRDSAQRRRIADGRRLGLEQRVKELEKQLADTQDPGDTLLADYAEAVANLEASRADIDEGRILADDTTPEALIRLLHRNAGTISLVSTEGGLFDNLGRYAERGTPPNLDGLLKIWSGDTVRVDRVSGDPIEIRDPRATVCLTVQPSVVAKVTGNSDFVGRGLVARFMIAQPETHVGTRNMLAAVEVSDEAARQWRDGVLAMHHRDGRALAMTEDASLAFHIFRQSLEDRRFIAGDLEHPSLTEMSTKCESSVARVALLIALAEGAEHVTLDHMNRAILLGQYWLSQAIMLGGEKVLDPLALRVRRLMKWIERRADGPVSVREVNRSGMFRRMGVDADAILEVFERAADLGLGEVDYGPRSPTFTARDSARHARRSRAESGGSTAETDESARCRADPKGKNSSFSLYIHPSTHISQQARDARDVRPEPDPDDDLEAWLDTQAGDDDE